ncbi:hypothetical protein K438DRAFT_1777174 [Mycena galopus ATCC 62051]|nr:hypothetical protein K438DRAFT_1777174 [Mycena galopus ATCC 62051]
MWNLEARNIGQEPGNTAISKLVASGAPPDKRCEEQRDTLHLPSFLDSHPRSFAFSLCPSHFPFRQTMSDKLTFAEKRKATIAANKAREEETNIAISKKLVSLKAADGRQAKTDALTNKIWTAGTRKRTSSTVSEVEIEAGSTKKARAKGKKSKDAPSVTNEEPKSQAASKSDKAKGKTRKHVAPDIDLDSDDDFKSLRRIQTAKPAAKPAKATMRGTQVSKSKKAAAQIVAESASDIDSSTSEDEEDTASSSSEEAEDSDDKSINDGSVDEEDFIAEVPRVVATHSKATEDTSDDPSSHELDDMRPRVSQKKSNSEINTDVAQALFHSDSEGDVMPTVSTKKGKSKAPAPKADSDSDDSMPDAPVRCVIASDIEMDDGPVPAPTAHRSHRSSMASSVASDRSSSKGSAYWSGRELMVPDSEPEDVEPEEAAPRPKKKSRKVSAARQRQADVEKPDIKPSVSDLNKGATSVGPVVLPESTWHISARIVLPAPNKDIGLTSQHRDLQNVLRDSIVLIKIFMFCEDAYPTMVSRAGFGRPYMIDAAEARAATHILDRLLNDPTFGAFLAPIPIDRMNIIRGNLKRTAVNCVPAFYGLVSLDPQQRKARVEELLKDHRYIFPPNGTEGKLHLDQPFCNGSFKFILKEEIFSQTAFITDNIERFPARLAKKPAEREVPDPMLALVGTAVYAALVEYRATGTRQNIPFSEDAYETTYRNHMSTLDTTRTSSAKALHNLLHALFTEAR